MLFINISSDYVHLLDEHQELFLPRDDIEETLGPALIQRYRQNGIAEIFVLNGPGGFTNLRVGCLALNLLGEIAYQETGKHIAMYSISKIELYAYLYKQGLIPNALWMYIGQRKNIREVDLNTSNWQQTALHGENTHIKCFDWVYNESYWGDGVHNKMISFGMQDDKLIASFQDKYHVVSVEELGLGKVFAVKPNYMIDPIMGG